MRLAFDFRQQFHKDVVIDLVCYRRHGHNEADEPSATQPIMYDVIKKLPPTREIYAKQLVQRGLIAEGDAKKAFDDYRNQLDAGKPVTELAPPGSQKFAVDWTHHVDGKLAQPVDTGVARDRLNELAARILTWPEAMTLQSRVGKIYADRRKMAEGEQPLDWGYAENMAYATLIDEGHRLRLVGQDSGRGTFFHRHAELHDQKTGNIYMPLAHIREDVSTSKSSTRCCQRRGRDGLRVRLRDRRSGHAGALGSPVRRFRQRRASRDRPVPLVRAKRSGIACAAWCCCCRTATKARVRSIPPRASSAYLQLCALDNMQVCVPTTPAQMFHMLRRQMLRDCRKPLVVMTPKSLLRHKLAVSSLDDLAQRPVPAGDPRPARQGRQRRSSAWCCARARSTTTCSRKPKNASSTDVAIVRVEQLYPFPRTEVCAELAKYPAAKEVIWCQEEPHEPGRLVPDPPSPASLRRRQAQPALRGARRARRRRPAATTTPTSPNSGRWCSRRSSIRRRRPRRRIAPPSFRPWIDGPAPGRKSSSQDARSRMKNTHSQGPIMAIEVKVPVLPESVSDATIATWHKKAGRCGQARREPGRPRNRQGGAGSTRAR